MLLIFIKWENFDVNIEPIINRLAKYVNVNVMLQKSGLTRLQVQPFRSDSN